VEGLWAKYPESLAKGAPFSLPKRGVSLHWKLHDRVGELAHERGVAWNRMAVKLMELGIPLLQRLDRSTPALARIFVETRYGLNEKGRRRIREVVEETAAKMRLNDRLSFALPSSSKEIIRREARQSKSTMSEVARRYIAYRES